MNGRIRAKEAIDKAMTLRDKVSPRERLYIEAIAARRDTQNKEADKAYIAKMRQLVDAYPGRPRGEVDAGAGAALTATTQ